MVDANVYFMCCLRLEIHIVYVPWISLKVLSECGNNAISETQISKLFWGACPWTPLDGCALRRVCTPRPPNVRILRTPLLVEELARRLFISHTRIFFSSDERISILNARAHRYSGYPCASLFRMSVRIFFSVLTGMSCSLRLHGRFYPGPGLKFRRVKSAP